MKKSSRTALSWPKQYDGNVGPLAAMRKSLGLGGGSSISNAQLFILAAIFAFNAGKIQKDNCPKANNSVRVNDLKDSQRRLLESIALSTAKSRKILLAEDDVFDICERYAAAGLELLFEARSERTEDEFALFVSAEIYAYLKRNQAINPRD